MLGSTVVCDLVVVCFERKRRELCQRTPGIMSFFMPWFCGGDRLKLSLHIQLRLCHEKLIMQNVVFVEKCSCHLLCVARI